MTSCSYNYYYIEKWDGAFAIDSVTIGALKRSYHEKRAGGDFGSGEYTNGKAQIFTYDAKTGELKEKTNISSNIGRGYDNSLLCSYPYLAISIENNDGVQQAFYHNIETGETKNIYSDDCWLWGISDSGKYIAIKTRSGKKIINVATRKPIDLGDTLLPVYIDDTENVLYCINSSGYDVFGDTLYSLDLKTLNKIIVCDDIDGRINHISPSSQNEYLIILRHSEQIRYLKISDFKIYSDTLKNISDFDTLSTLFGRSLFRRSFHLSNNVFLKIEDGDVYFSKINKPDSLVKILEGFEREE